MLAVLQHKCHCNIYYPGVCGTQMMVVQWCYCHYFTPGDDCYSVVHVGRGMALGRG